MSKTLSLARKELWSYFSSATALIFLGTYLLISLFTFFTFTFPAGLTIYWLTSNCLSILQQLVLNRIKTPEIQD